MTEREITMVDISNYIKRVNSETTIKEWKEITIELRDTFNLTDMEAINIMSGRVDTVVKVLERKKTSLATTR